MANHKLNLLIVDYRKQLGMHSLEFKTVSGTTHLIEVKWFEFSYPQLLLTSFSIAAKMATVFFIRLLILSIVCLQLPVDRKVPSNWIKINSTKKTTRYHTPEILKNLDSLMLATEELAVICRSTWHKFLTGFGKYYAQFQAVVESLAALDCLYSFAVLAKQNVMNIHFSLCLTCSYVKFVTNLSSIFQNYVRPTFVHESEPSQIHIKDGRHPVSCDSLFMPLEISVTTNMIM